MKTKAKKANLRTKIVIVLAFVIVFTIAVSLIIVSNAAFTNSRSAQRTIAAYDDTGIRFSSNYLFNVIDSNSNVRTIYTTSTTILPVVQVSVCNYPQGRPSIVYDTNITYTVDAKLVKYDSVNDQYVDAMANDVLGRSITVSDGTFSIVLSAGTTPVLSDSLSGYTLTGGTTDSDKFSVYFSNNILEFNPSLAVEIVVTPSNGLPILRGIFKPEFRVAGASNDWTGDFRDDKSKSIYSYDGYNFLITGVGTGTCVLKWNTNAVSMSDISEIMMNGISGATLDTISEPGWAILRFNVDADIESRYDIQFYKVNIPQGKTWSDMYTAGSSTSYIQFRFA